MADTEVVDDPNFLDLGLKKKKKKKKTTDLDGDDATEQPATPKEEPETAQESGADVGNDADAANQAEDDPNALFADLKKKKKKKKVPTDLDSEATEEPQQKAAAAAEEVSTDLDDLGALKKKKKKKDLAAFEEELGEENKAAEDAEEEEDFSSLKKKKKAKKPLPEEEPEQASAADEAGDGEDDQEVPFGDDDKEIEDEDDDADVSIRYEVDPMDALQGTDRDYTYQELLGRAFHKIRAANPDYGGDRKRYTMIPPQVLREGAKKTVFVNLSDICKRMHRHPDHVIQFLFAELGTSGSLDGTQRLVIKGRFQPKQIENVLRRYILEYVTCKICKSPDTILTKENRLLFVHCETCNSTRSVAAIKTGFTAQVGRRKR